MNVRVHITVDTEFSIAGAFSDPERRRPVGPPAVYCNIDGHSQGLGFLLETLARFEQKATFFVEALNTWYFGDDPMGEIARALYESGHDVQLHIHPCWEYFRREDWMDCLETTPPNDDVTRRTEDHLVELIQAGIDTFKRWDVPAPTVLRTGGLKANLAVYRAMKRCGLRFASNLGLAVFRPQEPELQLYGGCHEVEGVTEIPVTTYSDFSVGGRKHHKTLTITGCGWPEIRAVLQQSHDAGLSDVVLLTHCFEYVKHQDVTYEKLYPDRINQRRLVRLCEFLASEQGFEAATLGNLKGVSPEPSKNPLFSVPLTAAAGRILINRINHSIMRF